jgi:hypothetical protein
MKITMIAALITAGSLALASTAMAGDLSNEKFKSNSSTSKQESQTKCIATTIVPKGAVILKENNTDGGNGSQATTIVPKGVVILKENNTDGGSVVTKTDNSVKATTSGGDGDGSQETTSSDNGLNATDKNYNPVNPIVPRN